MLQLEPVRGLNLASLCVEVRRGLAGDVRVRRGGRAVDHRGLADRLRRDAGKPSLAERVAEHQPPYNPLADPKWRKYSVG